MVNKLLIINGASGSGKTTVAKLLNEQINDSEWIHPVGLWDTPNMEAEKIFKKVLERVIESKALLVIVDCQIRPLNIPELISEYGLKDYSNILLICDRAIRESRLLSRGWNDTYFNVIENWNTVLENESKEIEDLVLDSGLLSVEEICSRIKNIVGLNF